MDMTIQIVGTAIGTSIGTLVGTVVGFRFGWRGVSVLGFVGAAALIAIAAYA